MKLNSSSNERKLVDVKEMFQENVMFYFNENYIERKFQAEFISINMFAHTYYGVQQNEQV